MLLAPRHWRNAFQPTPLREAREVRFSRGTNNPPPAQTNIDNPAPAPDAVPPNPADTVRAAQGQTRAGVDQAIGAEGDAEQQAQPLRPTQLASKVEKLDKTMDDIRSLVGQPAVADDLRKLKPEEVSAFYEQLEAIDDNRRKVAFWRTFSADLAEWENMRMRPAEFRELIGRYYRDAPQGPEILASVDAYMAQEADRIRQWDMLNEDSKIELVRELSERARMQEIVDEINRYADAWLNDAELMRKAMQESVEKRAQTDKAHRPPSNLSFKGFFSSLGVSFHSPLEMWEAFKMVKQAFEDAATERRRRNAAILAKQWGGALAAVHAPYAREAQTELEKKVETDNNNKKNEAKETLERENRTFQDLFSEGGWLDSNKGDPNKVRGALEYAAGRGWLYDLKEQKGKWPIVLFGRFNLREMIPADYWSDDRLGNEFTTLLGLNKAGANKQKNEVKERELANDTYKPFVTALQNELNDFNFWGAIGVLEAAVQRGKEGHTSAHLAVVLMRKIRENPDIRKYLSGEVLENIGFATFNRTPFTLAIYAIDRGELLKWTRSGDTNLENAGFLGKWIGRVEQAIYRKNPALRGANKDTIDEMVGLVLATNTVDLGNGQTLSIFEPEFSGYRNENRTFDYYNAPSFKDDQDYFAQVSEVVLVPQSFYDSVLRTDSQGNFQDQPMAELFLGGIVDRYDDLDGKDQTAKGQLQREARGKLDASFSKVFKGRTGPLTEYRLRRKIDGKVELGDYALGALYKRGLLSARTLLKGGAPFANAVAAEAGLPPIAPNAQQGRGTDGAEGAAEQQLQQSA